MSAPMAEYVKITRSQNGRLNHAIVYDEFGGELCKLPLTGVERSDHVGEPPRAALLLYGTRVIVEDE